MVHVATLKKLDGSRQFAFDPCEQPLQLKQMWTKCCEHGPIQRIMARLTRKCRRKCKASAIEDCMIMPPNVLICTAVYYKENCTMKKCRIFFNKWQLPGYYADIMKFAS